ncbi:MAG: hypothetical protein ABFD10_12630 [Prolixibacteraceae bacterium]
MLIKNWSKNKKPFYRVTGACLLGLLGLFFLPAIFSSERLKNELGRYVDDVTNHEYQLTVSKIHFNPFADRFSLDSLRLTGKSAKGKFLVLNAKKITISGITTDLLFPGSGFTISKIKITDLLAEVYHEPAVKPEKFSNEELFSKLQAIFSKSVQKITVKDIEIRHVKIAHYNGEENPHPFRFIHDFDLTIIDFSMDSGMISRQKEFFRADEVFFKIRNFNRMLSDGIHQVQVGELTYSMQDKKLRGENIRLFPTDTTRRSATLYQVEIPAVEMEWSIPFQLTSHDTIRVKTLNLKQSKIRIKPSVRAKNNVNLRNLRDFDLYALFRNDFRLLTIDRLSMEDTQMRIDSRNENDSIFQEFKGIQIHMNGFKLDSCSWMDRTKILYSDNFKLSIGHYLLKLNDQVHQFSADKIFASSKDSLIQSSQIRLTPVNQTIKLPAIVNLSCDSIRLWSVDFNRLFHRREMLLNEITAFKPTVNIDQFGKPATKNRDHQSLLYYFIGNYIKGIYSNVVAIKDGHLAIHNLQASSDTGIIEAGIDFKLTGFSIDSITARGSGKLFYAAELDLRFSNYNMKLADEIHRLQIGKVNVSSIRKLVTVEGLHLFPDHRLNIPKVLDRMKKTELYRLKIPSLTLYNTDINRAFFSKNLQISHFSITKPDIYIELFGALKKQEKEFNLNEFYELLNNYLSHIEIEEFDVPNGQLRFVNHSRKGKTIDLTNQFSLHLDHFILNDRELNKDRLLFSDQFELTLKDHLFKLSDQVHLLKAKEISLSSRNASVSVSDALLYPLVSSPAYRDLPWHLLIRIPGIKLEQVDMNQIYFNHVLKVGSLSIDSPLIEIFRNLERSKLNFKDPAIPLPEEMKELTVGKASLKNGKLKIYKNKTDQQKLIAGADIDFLVSNGSLKRSPDTPTARFFSENIETTLTGLYFDPEKIPYSIDVKQVDFSSKKQFLQFTGLNIRSTSTGQKKVIAGINIPSLRFDQLDPVDAFQNNRFHAGLIHSVKPVFILNQTEEQTSENPLLIHLPPDILPLMDELSAGKVTVEDASFIFQQKNKKKEYTHISVILDEFRLDSVQSEKPLGSNNLTFYKDNNQFTDKNKHYDFQVDRISFSGTGNTFSLSGIKILPRYTRDAYQKVISGQTDHYAGSIDKIELTGIDPDRWFEKRELKAKAALITHPQINVYRDKRTPFNEKQFKPMPQELISQIDLPFHFDSVRITNANITYAEQPENLPGAGTVSFSGLNARLFPFSNMSPWKDQTVTLVANSLFMNSSKLNVRMDFNMASPVHQFKVKGSLSPFQLAALNPVTEFSAQILIRSGELNRFDFQFTADSLKAVGKLWFAYDNLRISVLEQKDGDTKESRWLSFLANNLMLKSKNPRTRTLMPDDICFERDPKRSVINYWWKTIFSGAKNTFGIKEEE